MITDRIRLHSVLLPLLIGSQEHSRALRAPTGRISYVTYRCLPQNSGGKAAMALLELAFFVALLRAQRLSATCTERELQRHLTSSEPPYDNYYNISKAVYPSVDLPSLLIRIKVRFHQSINQSVDSKTEKNLTTSNTSNVSNQTGENTRQTTDNETKTYKFTWSASCLYVSGGDLSLTSMNVFSLWAIYPNRREKKLDLTSPQFCRGVSLDTMIYFLSTVGFFCSCYFCKISNVTRWERWFGLG